MFDGALNGDAQVRLPVDLRPGLTYTVLLELRLVGRLNEVDDVLDVGTPGSDRWARYDAIEVCLAADPGGTNATEGIERDLYERRCYPELWLPAASGGRFEVARDLVALRTAQAVAMGEHGVNETLATRRLEEADGFAAGGEHQRACQALVQALHALTTP